MPPEATAAADACPNPTGAVSAGTGEDLSDGAVCLVADDSLFASQACIDGCEARATLATASRRRSSSYLGLLGLLQSREPWPGKPHLKQTI